MTVSTDRDALASEIYVSIRRRYRNGGDRKAFTVARRTKPISVWASGAWPMSAAMRAARGFWRSGRPLSSARRLEKFVEQARHE